jgi:hypothetical protein
MITRSGNQNSHSADSVRLLRSFVDYAEPTEKLRQQLAVTCSSVALSGSATDRLLLTHARTVPSK